MPISLNPFKHPIAAKVALTYVVLAATWILLSDRLVLFLFSDPETMSFASTVKGWLFVAVTATLLYMQLHVYLEQLDSEHAKLLESEARFRGIFNSVTEAIFIHRLGDFAIIDANQRASDLLGYSRDEFCRSGVAGFLSSAGPVGLKEAELVMGKAMREGPQHVDCMVRHKRGHSFWIGASLTKALLGETEVLLVSVQDIEERKRTEQALQRKNAIHAVLSGVNKAMLEVRDRQTLFDSVCSVALQMTGFRLAWVAQLVDERIQPHCLFAVSARGEAKEFVAEVLGRPHDAEPGKRSPALEAAKDRHYVVIDDIEHDGKLVLLERAVSTYGLRSAMSIPVEGGGFRGAISFFSGEANYFNVEVILLLLEVADSVSFALNKIYEKEEQERAEAQIRLHAQVFENTRDGMVITDAHNRIIMANRALTEQTGYSTEEIIGQNPNILSSGRHDRGFYAQMWAALDSVGAWQGEIWNRRKDGEVYLEWLSINTIRGSDGRISNYFANFSDLSGRKAQEELDWLKRFDVLTGLPNRLLLEDRANEAIAHARQYGRHVALLCINLNRFHYVNESLGHPAGDKVLKGVAERFARLAGEAATVSRLSGDNFVVLIPDMAKPSEAIPVAEGLLQAASEIHEVGETQISLTASIGVALYPGDGEDFDGLLKNSDAALVRARSDGGNTCQFYTGDLNERAGLSLGLMAELRQALDSGWFTLYYQPQVCAQSGKISGVEALVRLNHPGKGLISPADFIPIAEETGMIIPLGEWIMREACRQLREWQTRGLGELVMAINLSPKQLRDPNLQASILSTIGQNNLNPHHLELEFTESALLRDVASTMQLIEELKALGVRLSIDDFGTGYSSLSYLKRFPIDRIKIDQSFVRNIALGSTDAAIVQAIITLASSLGMTTIAEGVETEQQAECLRTLNCHELQGYFYGRPVPPQMLEARLLSNG
ncbi:PAS domain S-box-containing protein/diguanylate cyclase (GGDEF) domain-containing protein [Formivibrio citricus]|uniref:PAS domain S-box-containing protein/diguanylate cyclase (GGDEF) domain-containing protein n=1 Tax=Formivibrio citricus TaxID=83765 RepID=A0A1I5CF39_9NEIS|nr:EAL domain-containing protein [Formivibrio citricus]SFN85526.1 PAS domain S-box-containing protein/diguanylate cyclase (GGDEF) domain-containing protein [Formivibrio citricus]